MKLLALVLIAIAIIEIESSVPGIRVLATRIIDPNPTVPMFVLRSCCDDTIDEEVLSFNNSSPEMIVKYYQSGESSGSYTNDLIDELDEVEKEIEIGRSIYRWVATILIVIIVLSFAGFVVYELRQRSLSGRYQFNNDMAVRYNVNEPECVVINMPEHTACGASAN